MKTVALLGFGALSREFLNLFPEQLSDLYQIIGIYTRHTPHIPAYPFYRTMNDMLATRPDFVLEFAGGDSVREYGEQVLKSGSSLVIVSIGALADQALLTRLRNAAIAGGTKLHIASGAVGGFDFLRTMALAGTERFTIENIKAPGSLNGAPYLKGSSLPDNEEKAVFQGNATEAIQAFPKNVNVAIASALAADCLNTADVSIKSVPGMTLSTHRITVENRLAEAVLEFSSKPDPENPKSSIITAWSVAALLKNLEDPIQFF